MTTPSLSKNCTARVAAEPTAYEGKEHAVARCERSMPAGMP